MFIKGPFGVLVGAIGVDDGWFQHLRQQKTEEIFQHKWYVFKVPVQEGGNLFGVFWKSIKGLFGILVNNIPLHSSFPQYQETTLRK